MKRLAIIASLAALAGLAGCGSDDENPAASMPTVKAPALNGTFERQMIKADIERTDKLRDESGPGQEKPKPGPLQLMLKDGTLAMTDVGASLTVRQDFSATTDGELRVGAYQAPDRGAFCGPDIPATATYTFELSGDVLTLEPKQDGCADRDASLTGTWKRR
jgi:hypothetical protein